MKKKLLLSLPYFRQNEKKVIEKNGPIAGPEIESCLRQCRVCPDANSISLHFYCLYLLSFRNYLPAYPLKPDTDDSQGVREMRKTCKVRETWEKKRALDNVKINYTRFAIRLFSCTIILSVITRENPFVSCIITARHEKSVSWISIKNTK